MSLLNKKFCYYIYFKKIYQLYVFNFLTLRRALNNDFWLQIYFNRISGEILKYTPD